jgi:membrane-associated phospholipid phosphatase
MVKLVFPGISIRQVAVAGFRNAVNSRLLAYITAIFSVIGIAWIMMKVEVVILPFLSVDFTRFFSGIETGALIFIQRHSFQILTYFLSYFYIFVWPAVMLASLLVYLYHNDLRAFKNLVNGYFLSYLLVLPFFLLFPVNEAWHSGRNIKLLLDDISPHVVLFLRPLSGIDNCFPSFHVLLSFTVFFTALYSGYKRLAVITGVCAVIISFSTVYLGIHWISDGVSGIIFSFLITSYLHNKVYRPSFYLKYKICNQ